MDIMQEFKEQLDSHGLDIQDFECMLYLYNKLTKTDKQELRKFIGEPYKKLT